LVPDSTPRIGVATGADPAGAIRVINVDPGSTAALAGVKSGDELVSVGEVLVNDADFGPKFRLRYAGRPTGSPLPIVVKRGTQSLTLNGSLVYAPNAPRISEDPAATPKAIRVRNGILRGTLDK
jgi:C-terminal processing protease CtpA/Prc